MDMSTAARTDDMGLEENYGHATTNEHFKGRDRGKSEVGGR